mmetsp:Transcript_56830/g.116365  ORF Transcript_56830/g.116365 Transcript_56830/m.116365 type:complete len:606 (-) Transcript_56830:324-2141(-)
MICSEIYPSETLTSISFEEPPDVMDAGLNFANLSEEDSDDDHSEGLLLSNEGWQHPDDFSGCPVKPTSLVGKSKLTFLSSHTDEVQAAPIQRGSEEWFRSRGKFLASKEANLRQMHTVCAEKLRNIVTRMKHFSIDEVTLLKAVPTPEKVVSELANFIDEVHRLFAALNRATVPIQSRRHPAPFLPPRPQQPVSSDRAALLVFLEQTNSHLQQVAAILVGSVKHFEDSVQKLGKTPANRSLEIDLDDKGATVSPETFSFARSTDSNLVGKLLSAIDSVAAILDFVEQCKSSEAACKDLSVVPATHRPLMPAIYHQISATDFFRPEQDNMAFLSMIEQHLKPVFVPSGNTLIRSGTVGDSMFFVVSGNCKVEVDGCCRGERKSGEFFGEIALLYATKRMADIVVAEDSELLMLPRKSFDKIISKMPHILHRIKDVAAERVQKINLLSENDERQEEPVEDCKDHDSETKVTSLNLQLRNLEAANLLDDIAKEVEKSVMRRRFEADETILAAGSSGNGVWILENGSCFVQEASKLHPCETGCIFGLGPMFWSGKMGCDVVAGPEGAELIVLDEVALLEYFTQRPSAVSFLKKLNSAKAQADGAVWKLV